MIDYISIVLGLSAGLVGVAMGHVMRKASHALLFLRDPFFVFFCCLGWLVMIILGESGKVPFFATGLWNIMMLAFDLGYIVGYRLCNARDKIEIDLPTPGVGSNSLPLVYYIKKQKIFMMPQKFGPICKAVIGVRYPLDINLDQAANARIVSTSNGFKTVKVEAYPIGAAKSMPITVGKIAIKPRKYTDPTTGIEFTEKRYLFNFYAEEHYMRFAQVVIEDHISFWGMATAYLEANANAVEQRAVNVRLQIDLQTIKYAAAGDIVQGAIDLNIDAPNFQTRLDTRMQQERDRRKKTEDTGMPKGDDNGLSAEP